MNRLRSRAGLVGAIAVCVLTLCTPGARTTAVAAPSGPATIASVWPQHPPFTMPGTVQGEAYEPLAIVADGVSLGTVTTGDGSATSLVEVSGSAARFLSGPRDPSTVSYDAFAATPTALYWMRNLTDSSGIGHETLWTADRGAGAASEMSADVGAALFQGTEDDLRVTGTTLMWAAAGPRGDTEIRSIPLTGGAVTIRIVSGDVVLGPSPWMVSGASAGGTPVRLVNAATGARRTVPVASGSTATCSLAWCVVSRMSTAGASWIELTRLDGSAGRRLGGAQTDLVATEATQLDRFVVLSDSIAGQQGPTVIEQLWLYDIAAHRDIEITPAATAAYARGPYVWWSTGDNETLTWSGLDLAALR
jgi:hypothetical protein